MKHYGWTNIALLYPATYEDGGLPYYFGEALETIDYGANASIAYVQYFTNYSDIDVFVIGVSEHARGEPVRWLAYFQVIVTSMGSGCCNEYNVYLMRKLYQVYKKDVIDSELCTRAVDANSVRYTVIIVNSDTAMLNLSNCDSLTNNGTADLFDTNALLVAGMFLI